MNNSDQTKNLFKNLFKLIRHSNHGIVDSTISLLKIWFEIDINDNPTILKLSHGSLFFQIVTSIFSELFYRVVGDSQLKWFNELLLMIGQRWCNYFLKNIYNDIYNDIIRDEIINHIQEGLPILLCHKDEKIREVSSNLLGNLIAIDILWCKLFTSPILTSSELIIFFSNENLTDITSINHLLSSNIKLFLNKITTELYWQKIIGKVFLAINVYFHRLKLIFDSIC